MLQWNISGQSLIETRNGSDIAIKQYVWGLNYIDELVQIAVNNDLWNNPTMNDPHPWGENVWFERLAVKKYYALHDANYNVMGMADPTGILVERYEYTPYGQRQTYTSSGLNDPLCYAPISTSKRWEISSIAQPYSLNATGHQGLMHDEELGNDAIYNRARYLKGQRYLQRDPLGYVDGMSLYEYVGSSPINATDPAGLNAVSVTGGYYAGIGGGFEGSMDVRNEDCCTPQGKKIKNGRLVIEGNLKVKMGIGIGYEGTIAGFSFKRSLLGVSFTAFDQSISYESECGNLTQSSICVTNKRSLNLGGTVNFGLSIWGYGLTASGRSGLNGSASLKICVNPNTLTGRAEVRITGTASASLSGKIGIGGYSLPRVWETPSFSEGWNDQLIASFNF